MGIKIDESILGVRKRVGVRGYLQQERGYVYQRVYRGIAKGEHMDFIPGSYAQIKIPKFSMDYDKDIDKSLIGEIYTWEKFGSCRPEMP